MCFKNNQPTDPASDFIYFTLEDGKAQVTEHMPNDHSWLWRHDLKNCTSNHLSKEEHKKVWGDNIKKRNLITRDGYSVPRYDLLRTLEVGLYRSPEFMILITVCNRYFSFYLLDGIIPDVMEDNLSDDKFIQRYLKENTEQLYPLRPSNTKSLKTFGITPKHAHADSTYHYHIYELNDLLGKRSLYYVEVACRHNNRQYYTFNNENIARRFVKDYNSLHFGFCCQ